MTSSLIPVASFLADSFDSVQNHRMYICGLTITIISSTLPSAISAFDLPLLPSFPAKVNVKDDLILQIQQAIYLRLTLGSVSKFWCNEISDGSQNTFVFSWIGGFGRLFNIYKHNQKFQNTCNIHKLTRVYLVLGQRHLIQRLWRNPLLPRPNPWWNLWFRQQNRKRSLSHLV